jgi:EmrB/QacA subfamily drug resistance transporter
MADGTPAIAIPEPIATRSAPSRWLTLAVLCFSILIVNLDNTVLNVALPTLVRDLGATSTQLQWVVDAYALVFGGLLLVFGSLADRVGRKRTFVAGLVAFACGSAWAAFSGSVSELIAARASMGIGAALMMPSTLSIITDVFRDRAQRQRAIGFWAGTSGVGFALGPIVGGLLLAHFWWGSVFLINVPIALVGVLCAVPLVPNSKNPAAPRPDVVGAALSIVGLGLVLWSIIEAPSHGWSSALVVGPGFSGLVVVGLFAAWENASPHPMLNLAFFRRRSFSVAVCSIGLGSFALLGTLFLLTQFLQFDLGLSALAAGVRMLPIAAALALVAPASSVLTRKIGIKLTTATGLLVAAAGLWLISRATVDWTYVDMLPGMILVGIGAALVMPTVSGSVMSSVPRGDTGVGAATNGTFTQFGAALGVAVLGSLLSTRYQDRMTTLLAGRHVPHTVEQTILGSIGGALAVAARVGGVLGEVLTRAARAAFISGSNLALGLAAAVLLAGCLLALAALPTTPPPDAELEAGVDLAAGTHVGTVTDQAAPAGIDDGFDIGAGDGPRPPPPASGLGRGILP